MLSASHYRAYQDFLTLLTKFTQIIIINEVNASPQLPKEAKSAKLTMGRTPRPLARGTVDRELNLALLKTEFENLSQWFDAHIASISDCQIAPAHASRWQSVQTEILREFKLLSTDMLFLASARQNSTQQKRIKSIENRLSKLIDYCQIMPKDNN